MFRRPPSDRRLPQLTAALAVVATVLALAPAGSAQGDKGPSDPACEPMFLVSALVEHDPDFADLLGSESDGYPGLTVACTEVNGDGESDALWSISGGGSGGAMHAGIAVADAQNIGSLTIQHEQDGSHLVVGFVRGKPAIGTPRYARKDPNCCPSRGWRWHTYSPAKDGQVRESRLKTTKRKRCPIKADA